MKKVMILCNCNEWKEYSSFTIIGAFDDEDKIKEVICQKFLNGEIDWDGENIDRLTEELESEFYCNYSGDKENDDMLDRLETSKGRILKDIYSSGVREINTKATYITIQEFNLNEICE